MIDDLSGHGKALAPKPTSETAFEPSFRDSFWRGLTGSESPQDIPLDELEVGKFSEFEPSQGRQHTPIVRLQDEAAPPVGGNLSDYAEEALLSPGESEREDDLSILGRVALDHVNYYSLDTALVVGVGAGVAATFAHSYVDEQIYARVHHSVWHGDGRDWAVPLHATKLLGEGQLTLPIFAGLWLTSEFFDDVPAINVSGEWGQRSLRAFLVGGPPLLAMQYLTGGSRPLETEFGSSWHPFQDTNGASGHAFMGALPLLTAAEMIDWWPGKIALVVVSLFPGLSRVADDDHYASQAILGWTMAYVAATAVDRTEHPDRHVNIFPLITGDQVGAAMEYRW